MEQVKEALLRVHARVADLQALGGNTQVRRALSVIASEVNALNDVHILRICDDGGGRGDGGRGLRSDLVVDNPADANQEGDGPLALMTLQAEVRSEDRRRQMFVDPTEATQAAFYDFYTGRLDTLELRVSERTRSAVDEAHAAAIAELRRNAPLITVLSVAEPDRKKNRRSAPFISPYF